MATIKSSVMYGVSLCVTVKTESAWSSSNPVLKLGEVAVSTNCQWIGTETFSEGACMSWPGGQSSTGVYDPAKVRVKIGDGASKWSALKYLDYYNEYEIDKLAALTASGIYAVEQRCTTLEGRCKTLETAKTSLESRCKTLEEAKTSLETAKTNLETRCTNLEARCTSLENSIGTMAEALIKFTSRLIENIKQ